MFKRYRLFLSGLVIPLYVFAQSGQGSNDIRPSPQQLAYQERQLGAFIHFGPASYIESDMLSVPAADLFDPGKLDAEQWVKTARSFGAKHIVLTAKHHNGYCLWPTSTTDYSVKQSPWKNGQGDVVGEFVDACRKYGMKVGLYISGGDTHFGCTSTPDPMGKRKLVGDRNAYFPVFLEQIRELLTRYGEISYIWFDGAYDPFGWDVMNAETMQKLGTSYGDAIYAMVRDLQPGSVVFGGTRPEVRWSGNEQGWASYPIWNVVKPEDWAINYMAPKNGGWIPAEANIHTRDTWFWAPGTDKSLRNMDFLIKVYFESIGRGANLLINMTPDTSGLIPAAEVQLLKNLGTELEKTFANPLGMAEILDQDAADKLEIRLARKQDISFIEIEEDLAKGQRILQYKVKAFADNKWITVFEGQSVGRKRLQKTDPVRTDRIRLEIEQSAGRPSIRKFFVY
jgi:alpha-L-fucosidase